MRYDGTQHVISPLSPANRPIKATFNHFLSTPANHLNSVKHPHALSFSHSHPLIASPLFPLSNNACTSPSTRSGKTPITAPPHLWFFSSLSNTFPEAIARSDTRCIRSPSPFRQSRNPPAIGKNRPYPQNWSTGATGPPLGHLEVWMAGRWERCVRFTR